MIFDVTIESIYCVCFEKSKMKKTQKIDKKVNNKKKTDRIVSATGFDYQRPLIMVADRYS